MQVNGHKEERTWPWVAGMPKLALLVSDAPFPQSIDRDALRSIEKKLCHIFILNGKQTNTTNRQQSKMREMLKAQCLKFQKFY